MKYLGLTLLPLVLIACSAEEEIHTVEYYKTHEAERVAKSDWCDESAERAAIINCMNAHDAQAKIDIEIMMGEGFPIKK